jgi:AcrR family transcriptional regulator
VLAESGVAKATLYKNFGNKDGLVAAYLDRRHERQVARVTAALERGGTPREQVLAVFESQIQLFARPDFRGCAFADADGVAARLHLIYDGAQMSARMDADPTNPEIVANARALVEAVLDGAGL